MLAKWKQRIINYKVILQNAGYLTLIEIIRMAMPFIAMPYLIITVGAENYGLAVFAQTIISYFMLLINWGLDDLAVKDVSRNRNDSKQLNIIVSTVLGIKFLILIFTFIILYLGTLYIPFFSKHQVLYLYAFITCFSEVLYPIWFFTGIEKMKNITIIKSFSILFYVATVFIFVKQKDDFEYIVLLQSLGNLFAGFISMAFLIKLYKIRFVIPKYSIVKKTFIQSFPFFLSHASIVLNQALAKTISGIVFPMSYVTAMDLATKVCAAGFRPMQMLNQSVFPHIAKTLSTNFVRKYLKVNISLSFIVSFLMFILAPFGIPILAGGKMDLAVVLTQILSFHTFVGGISTYVGTPVLIPFGHSKTYNLSVILSSFVLVSCYVIMYAFDFMSIYGFAVASVVAEIFSLIYRLYHCNKYRLLVF